MSNDKKIFVYILGVAQDGGYPHADCKKECCNKSWQDKNLMKHPSSIALVNQKLKKYWLIDVTPDIKHQIHLLDKFNCKLSGIFITHAHFGHYAGLLNLGLEVMNLKKIPVYVMPQMKNFIITNSITRQLLDNDNIEIFDLSDNSNIALKEYISIMPFNVPHRNELSETVGFKVQGRNKSIIYLPDIDSWNNWEENLLKLIEENDLLFIDGTFYSKDEISYRNISKIPHPAIKDTMKRLSALNVNDRNKIYFTHLNHTNPAIVEGSTEYKEVLDNGFFILKELKRFDL